MATTLNKYISSEQQGKISVESLVAASVVITGATWVLGEATLTAASHNFLVGDDITVAGLDVLLNGAFVVKAVTENEIVYNLAADPGVISDVDGTVTFTTPKFMAGSTLTGGTSGAIARVKSHIGTGDSSVIVFDSISGVAEFADGETVTGRNISAVVDTVAGTLVDGALAGASSAAATSTDIRLTSSGIVKTTTVGTRVMQEVLVASRDLATKQVA
jgi:hypothetical protein